MWYIKIIFRLIKRIDHRTVVYSSAAVGNHTRRYIILPESFNVLLPFFSIVVGWASPKVSRLPKLEPLWDSKASGKNSHVENLIHAFISFFSNFRLLSCMQTMNAFSFTVAEKCLLFRVIIGGLLLSL